MLKKILFLSAICFFVCILICIVFSGVCEKKEREYTELVLFNSDTYEEEEHYPGNGINIPIFINSYKYIERELYLEDFDFIKIGTSISEVETRLGKANGTTGFGVMSKYYHLSDNSAIVIKEDINGICALQHCTVDENGETKEVWILR